MTLTELGAFAAIFILPIVIALVVVFIRTQRKILRCPHHPHPPRATEQVRSQLIDTGMRKMFWCTRCPWYRIV